MGDRELEISLTAKGIKLMNQIREKKESDGDCFLQLCMESKYEEDVNSRRIPTFLKGENMRFIEAYLYEEQNNENKSTSTGSRN